MATKYPNLISRLFMLTPIAFAYCLTPGLASAQAVPSDDEIHVTVAVMDPQTVHDVFGKRIAQRFVALQVTIRNKSEDHQYLIQDVSLDLAKVFPAASLAARDQAECRAKLDACILWNKNLDQAAKERDQRLEEAAKERDQRLDEAANERDERFEEAVKERDQRLAEAARERNEGVSDKARAKNKILDDAVKAKNRLLDDAVRTKNRLLDEAARARNVRLDNDIRTRNKRLDDAAQQECSCTKAEYRLSSLELSLLRGVAEKGQGSDPRNKVYRFLQAFGTVAGGLVGVAGFGSSYGGSIAVFNGPVLSAYGNAFPDYTINQMNRLSDSAYQSNTLVPRQQAKVIVAFVSQSMFLTKKQRDTLWKDPTELFAEIDFRRAAARVSGSFIVELKNLPPSVVAVQIDDDELKKFQDDKPSVRGYLAGRFSPDVKISLLNQTPKGLSIKLDGTPANNRLNFIIESTKPVAPDTFLNFEVANDQSVQTISRPIHYKVDAPTITDITPKEGALDTPALPVEITGTSFIPDETRLVVEGTGVKVVAGSIEVLSSTKLKAKLWIDRDAKDAPPGDRKIAVANPTGESIGFVTFKVKPAAAAPATPAPPEP